MVFTSIDFFSNKQKGFAPFEVQFFPTITTGIDKWQDTDDVVTIYQDTDDAAATFQDTDGE